MLVANSYNLISRCVEEGIDYGFSRAYKHTDNPSEEQLKQAVADAVMNEICEWFKFKDLEDDIS